MSRKCLVCGKEFESRNNAQKCCSLKCSSLRKKITDKIKISNKKLICETCGVEFVGNKNNKFCSKKCKINSLEEKKKVHTHTCIVCQNTFKNRNVRGKFCSEECKYEWIKNNPRYLLSCEYCRKEFKSNTKNQKYCSNECYTSKIRDNREKCVCKNCNKVFYKRKHYNDKNLYCSSKCSAEYMRKNRKRYCTICGLELVMYQKKYCSKECQEIDKIKNYTCEYCGEKFQSATKKKYCSDKCRRNKQFVSEVKKCKYCGELFKTQFKKSKIYCSNICSRKMKKIYSKLSNGKRAELLKINGQIDSDITLRKLYKKENGICAICGGKCDYKDYKLDDYKNFIIGNQYPSIDHIIPISKGGTHTWQNIQLAHRICNSYKGSGFIEKEDGQLSIF